MKCSRVVIILGFFLLRSNMTEGSVEGRRRSRRDEAKSHSTVRESRLFRGQRRSEGFP